MVTYNPRLPSITAIQHKQYIAKVYPEPPLIAFRRQITIREHFIRAKVPPPESRFKRDIKAITNYIKPCQAWQSCHLIMKGKEVSINIETKEKQKGDLQKDYQNIQDM